MRVTRPLEPRDAQQLSALLTANRDFLAPWQPLRPDAYFTVDGQRAAVANALDQQQAGTAVPLVILDATQSVVGGITLQSIIRGAFQSCSVGYWLGESAQGRGLATAALAEAVQLAF